MMADPRSLDNLGRILDSLRDDARNKRDLGDRFERLVAAFLRSDPLYADRFSDVWLFNDWPDKGRTGDVGIDIVARERATGAYCAVQCKFYLPEHTISKEDIDSFFTAAGKDPFASCMIVSTTDKWGKNAEDALSQTKPVVRIGVHDLCASPVDWSKFDPKRTVTLDVLAKKELRPHQEAAIRDVLKGFKGSDRGKLIMACGTGKTFTALRLAEKLVSGFSGGGHVLFLVPSLSLLSQSLREWTAEARKPIHALAVCSDANIGKRMAKGRDGEDDRADIAVWDLAFPATTSAKLIVAQHEAIQKRAKKEKAADRMTVVFSTYQSIEAVSKAQKSGLPEFDLVICDEAHRTTGVSLSKEDESHFVKVHDPKFIRAAKRLYMTATPRLYGDEAKSKAKEAEAILCSMDDPAIFGPEFHRLGFGEAVGKDLLADYKVLVLAVDEKYISTAFQKQIADKNNELNLEDAVKITGCWSGLAKRFAPGSTDDEHMQGDAAPMRRAVAFSRSIAASKAFVRLFGQIIDAHREKHPEDERYLRCEADHVDGTFNALKRTDLLEWLKAPSPDNTCRILSNARCLSEGVDVPALDAVMFLNPRDSVVDVVQSVGRVMRKAPGKQYGYIILPVGIPADIKPEEALRDNEKYKVVWQVLQALRAHDDRFNATINQIELNKARPENIQVIGVGGDTDDGTKSDGDSQPKAREVQATFAFPQLDDWKDAIYSKIVLKCGDRRYWETWAADVAKIADRHTTRIKALLDGKDRKQAKAFAAFLAGLQTNLNPAVGREDAIEMLSQHLITRPIFDALFGSYAFAKANPVSLAMQEMLDALDDEALHKEAEALEKFYASVKTRVDGIDNAEGRQKVVVELYDKFFRIAFPRMAERLGIVYTPVEVVDFIIRSVEDVLREEFGTTIGAENVHIIDPFTGTGTFIVRLLQSGLIKPADLPRKYTHELHANEIVLLAYYIAAINIEETYHGLMRAAGKDVGYESFEGIVLTDTFQLFESGAAMTGEGLPENTARVKRQRAAPIRVVMSNPPYSAQQESENDNNANLEYPALDQRIRSTYAERSNAKLLKNLYDSYIRAIRWATDRINGHGVVAFVTNGSFIDANNMDGLRACLVDEFTSLYIFNLRGNARTQGEQRKAEAGSVFGAGTRTPVAVTVMVKNSDKTGPAVVHYHDIGDYLSREQKLAIVAETGSIGGLTDACKWQKLTPNTDHDWINQRDPAFERFMPLGDKEGGSPLVFFDLYSQGLLTARDSWCYNASRKAVATNMRRMVETYTADLPKVQRALDGVKKENREGVVEETITTDAKAISWSRALKADVLRGKPHKFADKSLAIGCYRPYTKQWVCFDRALNEFVYKLPQLFPEGRLPNIAICVDSRGSTKDFSALIVNTLPDYECISKGQCFPLYAYTPADETEELNFGEAATIDGYRCREAITDAALKTFREAYGRGGEVTKEDIFYYVYGVLHSPEYRTRFASNLKKELPRIPLTKEAADFQRFSKAGRDLAHWHLNYETIEPYPLDEHSDTLALDPAKLYAVTKMTYARPTAEQKAAGAKWDKTRILYNSHVTLSGIPPEALDYVVNGKPALEWVMERYQITVDKDSGIKNDPNDWSKEHNQPRYIIDLVKRVVRVSVETVKIVKSLPALNERS